MTRTITRVAVSEILRNVNYSVDLGRNTDWFAILAAKVSHDHFDWLADEIADNGFTVPIVISASDDGDGWTLGNGHHRLCAAILLALDTVPVIFAGPYDWVSESHDNDREIPEGSHDYWGLLRDNIEGVHYGDESSQAWRAQYRGYSNDDDNSEPEVCSNCYGCRTCCGGVCRGRECTVCDERIANDRGYSAHLIACPEREYEILSCPGDDVCEDHRLDRRCGHNVYRYDPCAGIRDVWHGEALAEHLWRGHTLPLPANREHPAGVWAEALAEHAEREREAALKAAQQEWHAAIADLRDLIERGAGEWRVGDQAVIVADKQRAWFAL